MPDTTTSNSPLVSPRQNLTTDPTKLHDSVLNTTLPQDLQKNGDDHKMHDASKMHVNVLMFASWKHWKSF
ncbi:hypothetical protein RRG08_044591 [Elysia crispata]|uniref:Uncharacterized protein n=1 Tax=Elysia crispata TaxID=231223 RepID=A0AAE0ZTB1_9GAST|nr:hypothetical protein RRG08_044591 [Elysia crispata]